jgi:hypothetical protein
MRIGRFQCLDGLVDELSAEVVKHGTYDFMNAVQLELLLLMAQIDEAPGFQYKIYHFN